MERNTIFRTIILSFALIVVADAYSAGAPAGVCESMTPQHGVDAQKSDFPYTFTTTKKGTQLLITIKTKTETDSFKGFILQVRNSNNKPIGTFKTPAPTDSKFVDCAPHKQNALTHNSSNAKKEIKATWTAPANFVGSVTPIVTVARDGGTYWVNHKSAAINLP